MFPYPTNIDISAFHQENSNLKDFQQMQIISQTYIPNTTAYIFISLDQHIALFLTQTRRHINTDSHSPSKGLKKGQLPTSNFKFHLYPPEILKTNELNSNPT